jgi:2,4-diketo-3-deoxy-L-fuconate hydrolase
VSRESRGVPADRCGFQLGTFSRTDAQSAGPLFVGLVRNDQVIDLNACAALPGELSSAWRDHSMLTLLADWVRNLPRLQRLADSFDSASARQIQSLPLPLPLASLTLHPPLIPRQIFCTIGNYRKQTIEAAVDAALAQGLPPADIESTRARTVDAIAERARTGTPYICTKLPSTVTAANGSVGLPAHVRQADWEVELGVVIGRHARHVERKDALSYVAGYTLVNDITIREQVFRSDLPALGTDWLQSKGAPGFLPVGPYLVPASQIADPHDLRLLLKLNGDVMQDETTADMVFDIARQIEYISRHAQLWPGDLICTGSPAGFGAHYGRFLKPGDVVEASIEGFGSQRILFENESFTNEGFAHEGVSDANFVEGEKH